MPLHRLPSEWNTRPRSLPDPRNTPRDATPLRLPPESCGRRHVVRGHTRLARLCRYSGPMTKSYHQKVEVGQTNVRRARVLHLEKQKSGCPSVSGLDVIVLPHPLFHVVISP